MKTWFLGLQQQERVTVIGGAIALAIMLFYSVVWDPIHTSVAQLEKNVAKQGPLFEWMKQASNEVKELRDGQSSQKITSGQSLLSLIDSTAKEGQLGNALKRVKPDGDKKVRVWLEQASFDDMIKWLEGLNRAYTIEVSSLVIDRKDTPGIIDSRIVFVGL
ncbi:MAG: type II secretion system protein M [Gammaproteobacteria bacterium]|nr:type II secretion system protein M [Gammaproteobacteria bacterium]